MSKNPQSMKHDSFGDMPPKLLCAHDGRNPRVEASVVTDGREKTPLPYIATIRDGISEGVKLPTEESDRIFYCALVDFFGKDSSGKPKPWEPNPSAYYNYALVCEPMVANKTLLRMTEKQKNDEGREGPAPIFYWKTQRDKVSGGLRPVLNLMMSRRFCSYHLPDVETYVCADVSLLFDQTALWGQVTQWDNTYGCLWRAAAISITTERHDISFKRNRTFCSETQEYVYCTSSVYCYKMGDENGCYESGTNVTRGWLRTDEVALDETQDGENTYWYATLSQNYIPLGTPSGGVVSDYNNGAVNLGMLWNEVFVPGYEHPRRGDETGSCVFTFEGRLWIVAQNIGEKRPYSGFSNTTDFESTLRRAERLAYYPQNFRDTIDSLISSRQMPGVYRTSKGDIAKAVFGERVSYEDFDECLYNLETSLNFICVGRNIVGPRWSGGTVEYEGETLWFPPTQWANGGGPWSDRAGCYSFRYQEYAPYPIYDNGETVGADKGLGLQIKVHYTIGRDPLPEKWSVSFKLPLHNVSVSEADRAKYGIIGINKNGETIDITFNPRVLVDNVNSPSPITIPLTIVDDTGPGHESGSCGRFKFEKDSSESLTWEPIEAPTWYGNWDHNPPFAV